MIILKAIIYKRKDGILKLEIVSDTKTEKRFLKHIIKGDDFILKTRKSINFIVDIVRCDTCKYNEFQREVEGIRNGKKVMVKLGRCNCPEMPFYRRIGRHVLGEGEYQICTKYKRKEN